MDPFFEGIVTSAATEKKVKSGAEGYFEIKLLNPGDYRLQVSHSSFTDSEVWNLSVAEGKPVDAGTITLAVGGMIRGRVYDPAGARWGAATCGSTRPTPS